MKPKKSIEYSEKEWNPYTGDRTDDGKCEIVNRYGKMACWACSMAYRLRGRAGYDYDDPFKPTFHPDKLDEPLKRKKPTIYATCFMGDIAYCKPEWMIEIMGVICKCPQHTFLMLTKLPELVAIMFNVVSLPDNVWMGVTVNTQKETTRIEWLKTIQCAHYWLSFEPPFERIECDLKGINGIAIGALTQGGKTKFMPRWEVVDHLLEQARRDGAKIVTKANLRLPKGILIREWP